MEREINCISIHCSDSDLPEHDDPNVIRDWHIRRGFRGNGYNYCITKDGKIHETRPIHIMPAAVLGHNQNMIAICLTGKNKFSDEQFSSLISLVNDLVQIFHIDKSKIQGHNYWDKNKTCPNFNINLILSKITTFKKEKNMEGFLGIGQIGVALKLVSIITKKIIVLHKDGFQFSDVGELISELGSDEEFAKCITDLFMSMKKQ